MGLQSLLLEKSNFTKAIYEMTKDTQTTETVDLTQRKREKRRKTQLTNLRITLPPLDYMVEDNKTKQKNNSSEISVTLPG